MTPEAIERAAAEATRFLTRVAAWREVQGTYLNFRREAVAYSTPKQCGAVRRASMDLTRSLAEMRRRPEC